MTFAFIDQARSEYPLQRLCQVLQVSISGYYHWQRRTVSAGARANRQLVDEIRTIHTESGGTYGSPRIHAELRAQGRICSRKRSARLHGIQGRCKRRRRIGTTRTDPRLPVVPNLLKQAFHEAQPNAKWVADITYISTQSGWLYLAVVLDIFCYIEGFYNRRRRHSSLGYLSPDEFERRHIQGLN